MEKSFNSSSSMDNNNNNKTHYYYSFTNITLLLLVLLTGIFFLSLNSSKSLLSSKLLQCPSISHPPNQVCKVIKLHSILSLCGVVSCRVFLMPVIACLLTGGVTGGPERRVRRDITKGIHEK